MARAFIGVGSNLEPEDNVRAALQLLARHARLDAISTFYRTPALGRPEQPDYYDGVVSIETGASPRALKAQLRAIERTLGRRRTDDRYAARTIDLDLLLYDSLRLDSPGLRLPSADIASRAFVAVPLAEIAPELKVADESIGAIAARLPRTSMSPLAGFSRDLRRECGCASPQGENPPAPPV